MLSKIPGGAPKAAVASRAVAASSDLQSREIERTPATQRTVRQRSQLLDNEAYSQEAALSRKQRKDMQAEGRSGSETTTRVTQRDTTSGHPSQS